MRDTRLMKLFSTLVLRRYLFILYYLETETVNVCFMKLN